MNTDLQPDLLQSVYSVAQLAFNLGGQINYWLNTFAKKSHA
jgi:membrane protein YqaA with SNARE-associated domain